MFTMDLRRPQTLRQIGKEYYYHFTDNQYNICISQGYPEKQNQ